MAASLTVDEQLVKAVWEYPILCDKSLKDLRARSCSEIKRVRKEIVFTGRKVPYRMSAASPTSCCLRRKNSSRTQLLLLCRIFSRRLLQRRIKMTSNGNLRSTSSSAILNGLYLESEVSAGVSASLASTYTRSKRSSDSASNSDHALVASVASVNQP